MDIPVSGPDKQLQSVWLPIVCLGCRWTLREAGTAVVTTSGTSLTANSMLTSPSVSVQARYGAPLCIHIITRAAHLHVSHTTYLPALSSSPFPMTVPALTSADMSLSARGTNISLPVPGEQFIELLKIFHHETGCLVAADFSTIKYCTAGGGGAQANDSTWEVTPGSIYFCHLPGANQEELDMLSRNLTSNGLDLIGACALKSGALQLFSSSLGGWGLLPIIAAVAAAVLSSF